MFWNAIWHTTINRSYDTLLDIFNSFRTNVLLVVGELYAGIGGEEKSYKIQGLVQTPFAQPFFVINIYPCIYRHPDATIGMFFI